MKARSSLTWPSQIITPGRRLPEVTTTLPFTYLGSELLLLGSLLLSGSLLLLPELLSLLVPVAPWSVVVLPCDPRNEPAPVPPTPVSACTPKCENTL